MVRNIDWLHDVLRIEPRAIVLGNGMKVFATHRGTLFVRNWIRQGEDVCERDVVYRNVLFVPDLKSNLISCSVLCNEEDYSVNFNSSKFVGLKDGIIQFQRRRMNGVFRLSCVPIIPSRASAHVARSSNRRDDLEEESIDIWHTRLGHAHPERIRRLLRTGAVTGTGLIQKSGDGRTDPCSACILGKQSREVLRPNKSPSKKKCAVIHADVCGPMSVSSFSGARYFVCFVDEYSGHKTVIPIARKSDVKSNFIWYQAWIERKFDCSVKRLHSDNGGEFIALASYLKDKGIEHTMSPSYSPNLNGTAERANRSIVESARAMLQYAGLPRKFWAEAVVYAAKIQNVFHCPRSSTKTCHELMTGEKPSIRHFKVFGCLAWNHIPQDLRKKLDAKSEMGIVINCFENSQYKLWIPSRRVAVISRDVKIAEEQYPARGWKDNASEEDSVLLDNGDQQPSQHVQSSSTTPVNPSPVQEPHTHSCGPNEAGDEPAGQREPTTEELDQLTHYPDTTVTEDEGQHNDEEQDDAEVQQGEGDADSRYPKRVRKPPSYFVPGSAHVACKPEDARMTSDPSTVPEALSMEDGDKWQDAIASELQSLKQHGTWKIVEAKKGIKPLSTRFVFLRKYDDKGNVLRHKARLVVKGYMQGNVDMTFAPVVDFSSVRTAIAVAVQRGYEMHQMDVRTAFLHGEIDGAVYITPPEGVELCKPGQLLKLRRGLYGLKQAPRLWHDKWLSVMNVLGFTRLKSDPCIFRRGNLWLLLYVDDIILISPYVAEIDTVKSELGKYLDVKDLGTLRSFLGVTMLREGKKVLLSQKHYIQNVLKRFGLENCRPVSTPMCTGAFREAETADPAKADKHSYQELLGCMLFLSTRTRPDISSSVSILCRSASEPKKVHWIQLKRIARYLKGTVDYCLHFTPGNATLSAYCDADWAGDRSDRKSTTGFVLFFGTNPVCWQTIKQKSVALSTTEAEFVAMSESAKLVTWIRKLLEELDAKQIGRTVLNIDNQGALVWGNEGIRHAKHISIRKNFVKECTERGIISLAYCRTTEMVADVLTKPLLRLAFEKHRRSLRVNSLH